MALALAKVTPLARRMRAWWDGYVFEELAEAAAEPAETAVVGEKPPAQELPALDGRLSALFRQPSIHLKERVWGTGFDGPGDAEWVANFVGPLALDKKTTVAHLGAGLGGVTRAIAEATGAWTTGYEARPDYVEAGQELSTTAGLAKRAPVVAYKPPTIPAKDSKCHAVVAVDGFRTIADKSALYNAAFATLKLDGQLLFTDYLLKGKDHGAPAVADWLALEPMPVHLAAPDETRAALVGTGFDVRIVEDFGEEITQLIVAGWARFAEALTRANFDRRLGAALSDELALWLARLRVLDSGEVRPYRIHAMKLRAKK